MSSFDQGAKIAREKLQEGEAAAKDSMFQIERNFSTSIGTVRDFNVKTIEMMRTNAEAAFDLAHNLATATSPTDIFEVWRGFTEQQIGTLQKQTQELTALTQTAAQETMRPVQDVAYRYTSAT